MATTTTAVREQLSTAQPVHLSGVGRTFDTPNGPRPVLRDVELEIASGEILAIIGASGCGKSTLLRQVIGLDRPDAGDILIADSPTHDIDPRVAIAFQEPRLLPWRTLAQNVALGLPKGTASEVGKLRVTELLALVGLEESAGLRPRQVSGGMAQRASLARALARNPGVLLLDEPFGALDALTRLKMQDLLLEIHAAEPTTVILVTHDVEEALFLADRVVLLDNLALGAEQSIQSVTVVPGERPRDRTAVELTELRASLLEGLGVSTHHAPSPDPDTHHSI